MAIEGTRNAVHEALMFERGAMDDGEAEEVGVFPVLPRGTKARMTAPVNNSIFEHSFCLDVSMGPGMINKGF